MHTQKDDAREEEAVEAVVEEDEEAQEGPERPGAEPVVVVDPLLHQVDVAQVVPELQARVPHGCGCMCVCARAGAAGLGEGSRGPN